jgi:hypothetical protein
MTDTTLTDMAPFFERHEHRSRLVSVAAISASLVLSAVIFAHGVRATGAASATPASMTWAFGVVFTPVVTIAWWGFTEWMARRRRKGASADGGYPAGMDDARNGVRVANAGFLFHIGLNGAVLAQQAFWALVTFGYPVGDLIPRATTVAVGAATIYLGNLWPRLPTARAPEPVAAKLMKVNRFCGWLMVTTGLLVVLLGLFLPLLYPHMAGHRPYAGLAG